MVQPPKLKRGDTIMLIAPARAMSLNEIAFSTTLIESWGLEVIFSQGLLDYRAGLFAGSIETRISDFQIALDDPTIKAIWCVRGGYGSIQLIDHLDFMGFKKNPKWLIGYSDITVFHQHIYQQTGIETVHATMPVNLIDNTDQSIDSLRDIIFGETYSLQVQAELQSVEPQTIIAEIVGGNLSIICTLIDSRSSVDTTGKILFIEDIDEYLYHIERMMFMLKRSNKLVNIRALLVGGMTDLKDNAIAFGKDYKQIIETLCSEYNFPIIYDFPAGHLIHNMPLILGRRCTLQIDRDKYSISF